MDSERSGDIKFVKLEHGKTKREFSDPLYDPRPQLLQKTSADEVKHFRTDLRALKRPCGFLHVLPDDILVPSFSSSLPPTPRSSREKVLVKTRSMSHPASLQQIAELAMDFIGRISLAPTTVAALEEATAEQSQSKRWHEEHFGRITSSRFGEIIKCRQPSTLCTRLLYLSKAVLSSAAIQWGRTNEQKAREAYAKQLLPNLIVRCTGIRISGFIGASPDGIVCSAHDHTIQGLLEIKCPYSARKGTVAEACDTPSFFCKRDENGLINLRHKHNYYYQIQGQLAVFQAQWCDFVAWTPTDTVIERISFDARFWEQECLPRLTSFYYNSMLPEVIYPRHPDTPYDYSATPLCDLCSFKA